MNLFADLPLFQPAPSPSVDAGEQGKANGMAMAWESASPQFREAALQVLKSVARRQPELSVNDLWDGLEMLGITTHENRASGPAMREAACKGWIECTDRTIKTSRPSRHKGDVRVWRSLLFNP